MATDKVTSTLSLPTAVTIAITLVFIATLAQPLISTYANIFTVHRLELLKLISRPCGIAAAQRLAHAATRVALSDAEAHNASGASRYRRDGRHLGLKKVACLQQRSRAVRPAPYGGASPRMRRLSPSQPPAPPPPHPSPLLSPQMPSQLRLTTDPLPPPPTPPQPPARSFLSLMGLCIPPGSTDENMRAAIASPRFANFGLPPPIQPAPPVSSCDSRTSMDVARFDPSDLSSDDNAASSENEFLAVATPPVRHWVGSGNGRQYWKHAAPPMLSPFIAGANTSLFPCHPCAVTISPVVDATHLTTLLECRRGDVTQQSLSDARHLTTLHSDLEPTQATTTLPPSLVRPTSSAKRQRKLQ